MRFDESEAQSVTVRKVIDSRIPDRVNGGARAMVLDLENVTFIDSSGLGALVAILKVLGTNGAIALRGVRGALARACDKS